MLVGGDIPPCLHCACPVCFVPLRCVLLTLTRPALSVIGPVLCLATLPLLRLRSTVSCSVSRSLLCWAAALACAHRRAPRPWLSASLRCLYASESQWRRSLVSSWLSASLHRLLASLLSSRCCSAMLSNGGVRSGWQAGASMVRQSRHAAMVSRTTPLEVDVQVPRPSRVCNCDNHGRH